MLDLSRNVRTTSIQSNVCILISYDIQSVACRGSLYFAGIRKLCAQIELGKLNDWLSTGNKRPKDPSFNQCSQYQ